jgi:hypothetical protein
VKVLLEEEFPQLEFVGHDQEDEPNHDLRSVPLGRQLVQLQLPSQRELREKRGWERSMRLQESLP